MLSGLLKKYEIKGEILYLNENELEKEKGIKRKG